MWELFYTCYNYNSASNGGFLVANNISEYKMRIIYLFTDLSKPQSAFSETT